MKKFWKKTEGFTLVELIVVIAILGILAGVGTVGYSGYIKKANMAADQQLVSQVKNALELHYYADPTNAVSDYVVLKVNADADDGGDYADAAMKAAFGDGWKKTAQLKYSGWAVSNVLPSKDDAEKIVASSYYQNNSPAELISSFTGLTDALAGMSATASRDPLETMKGLVMSDAEIAALRTQLNDLGVSWEKDKNAYTTAVSNLLVNNVATEISGLNDGGTPSQMAQLALTYATLYGWASTSEDGAEVLEELNNTLKAEETDSSDVVAAINAASTKAGNSDTYKAYIGVDGQANHDALALPAIMGTVSNWGDSADMTISGLYSSDSITNAVNNYFAAVDTILAMGADTTFADALNGADGVVVFITSDGKTGCNISLD